VFLEFGKVLFEQGPLFGGQRRIFCNMLLKFFYPFVNLLDGLPHLLALGQDGILGVGQEQQEHANKEGKQAHQERPPVDAPGKLPRTQPLHHGGGIFLLPIIKRAGFRVLVEFERRRQPLT
jgi:hypothetical protein